MPKHSYEHWKEHELMFLNEMYKDKVPNNIIAKALQRTERSVECAIKNILLQKVINNGLYDTISEYDLEEEDIYDNLIHAKYNINNIDKSKYKLDNIIHKIDNNIDADAIDKKENNCGNILILFMVISTLTILIGNSVILM